MKIALYCQIHDYECAQAQKELRLLCAQRGHELVIWTNDHGDGFTGNPALKVPYIIADGITCHGLSGIREFIKSRSC